MRRKNSKNKWCQTQTGAAAGARQLLNATTVVKRYDGDPYMAQALSVPGYTTDRPGPRVAASPPGPKC